MTRPFLALALLLLVVTPSLLAQGLPRSYRDQIREQMAEDEDEFRVRGTLAFLVAAEVDWAYQDMAEDLPTVPPEDLDLHLLRLVGVAPLVALLTGLVLGPLANMLDGDDGTDLIQPTRALSCSLVAVLVPAVVAMAAAVSRGAEPDAEDWALGEALLLVLAVGSMPLAILEEAKPKTDSAWMLAAPVVLLATSFGSLLLAWQLPAWGASGVVVWCHAQAHALAVDVVGGMVLLGVGAVLILTSMVRVGAVAEQLVVRVTALQQRWMS